MRHVPMSAWAALSKSYAQQDFMVKLATDAEFAARVAEALR